MAWDLAAAVDYISLNTLDNEDFLDADDNRKNALLNVSSQTLTRKFSKYSIPDNAVYVFANTLASAFNDTNKLQRQGVKQFSVKGIAFSFNGGSVKGLIDLIPQECLDLIGEENGVKLATRRVGRSVR